MTLVHASCVAFGNLGVLIRGKPGAGKSSLCLRLIEGPLPAVLVADDQVELQLRESFIHATAPQILRGKLEIRGLGLVAVKCQADVRLRMVVDLMPFKEIERLPAARDLQTSILGITLPRLTLDAADAAAPARLRAALNHFSLV